MKTGRPQSAIVLASLGVLGITVLATVRTHGVVGPLLQESKTYVVSAPDTEQEMKVVVTDGRAWIQITVEGEEPRNWDVNAGDDLDAADAELDREHTEVWIDLQQVVQSRAGDHIERAFVSDMKADLLYLVGAQEAYFSDYVTYLTDLATLEFTSTPGVTITISAADADAWNATATHVETSTICTISIGFGGGDATADSFDVRDDGIPRCKGNV